MRVGLSYPNLKSTQVSNFFVRRSNGADDRFEPLKLGSPHKISKFSRVRVVMGEVVVRYTSGEQLGVKL